MLVQSTNRWSGTRNVLKYGDYRTCTGELADILPMNYDPLVYDRLQLITGNGRRNGGSRILLLL